MQTDVMPGQMKATSGLPTNNIFDPYTYICSLPNDLAKCFVGGVREEHLY